jgi:hypothetical protein
MLGQSAPTPLLHHYCLLATTTEVVLQPQSAAKEDKSKIQVHHNITSSD